MERFYIKCRTKKGIDDKNVMKDIIVTKPPTPLSPITDPVRVTEDEELNCKNCSNVNFSKVRTLSKFLDEQSNVYSDTEYESVCSDKESGSCSSDYEENSDLSEQLKRKFQGSSPDNF